MQIVNKSYFQSQNFLNIPLSTATPSGSVSPSNSGYLDMLCIKIEKEILLRALGLVLYTEKEALTDVTIEEAANLRWKKLIEGEDYDTTKKWNGLKYAYSLIAYRVFEEP